MDISYFDHAASTRTDPRVVEAMMPYFDTSYGNASELHQKGLEAKEALEDSRQLVADFIGARPEEIVFTSGGTESDNLAVKGIAYRQRRRGKHIIISSVEHAAVYNSAMFLKREEGFDVTVLPVDREGFVDPADVESAIREDTTLVSVIHGNNEIGTIEPVVEIGAVCKEHDVIFHTDAVQTFGKVPIDVNTFNVDLLAASSHKIYGPKGVGVLYVRKGVKPTPLMHGGDHEAKLRAGTENITGIVGLAKAVELCREGMGEECERLRPLRDRLIDGVLEGTPTAYLNGPRDERRLPNNAHFGIRYIEGESLMLRLDALGFQVSTGSACSSTSLEPSRTLIAIGLAHEDAHGSLRCTLGRWTRPEEVDAFIEALPGVVKQLHAMSPLYADAMERGEI
ncbi:MAG: aminotransferase class V-fold PLP-dependent enzyme [Thermoplasmata archaeon]|nr:cysteine desulfurase [Thermoplasmata archaeon]NIS11751.1 cysteine desulfurase [Thermoplasmata archaeon]NIS21610.1 cysteine desulfurase [Thermoplasmata archaeon]NIT76819.1 cysteine desulfurase [Thermoplasmata archaeon]NIU48754.1 cysteine desulfurase [Thermoplasmata archaeon]